jgi:hypothetical protein
MTERQFRLLMRQLSLMCMILAVTMSAAVGTCASTTTISRILQEVHHK